MARDDITVGVDFSRDGVRLAAVQVRDDATTVVGTHRYGWPRGAWNAGVIAKATVVREGIRQAFAEAAFPTRRVVLMIGGASVNTILELPRMTDAELAEPIEWEADQHVPPGVATMQLEYRVIEGESDRGSTRVVLHGFTREAVDEHVAVAREAGLQPRAVELEVEALRRLAVSGVDAGDRPLAVLRASSTDVAVLGLRRGEVVFDHTLPSTSDAETVAAVGRALKRFEATHAGNEIEQVLVAGPDAAAWDAVLRADGSFVVERLLPRRIARAQGVGALDAYATAIGLALPGPPMQTAGKPQRPAGLWSRLTRTLRGTTPRNSS
ncbi:MAG: pilus assembly protein PilM [Myxococcota bacterium]